MSEAKYHHRIPQTYMKSWCFSGDSVWWYDKESKTSKQRNIGNIMGVNHFHSIKAGSIFTTPAALDKIFAPIDGHTVINTDDEGTVTQLTTKDALNQKFYNYDYWTIKDPNGIELTSKQKRILYAKISQICDNSIEEAWSQKYENAWKNTITEIEQAVRDIHDKKPIELTDTAYHTIIDYFVMFQWRSKQGYDEARKVINWITEVVPEIMLMTINDSVHKEDQTVADEMWHNYLLSQYHKFLNGDGVMTQELEQYFEKLTPIFLLDKTESIITSDNPCFTFINRDGYREPILVALPGLIISLAKKDPDAPNSYRIYEMNSEDVRYYNRVIFENGNEIISKTELDYSEFAG